MTSEVLTSDRVRIHAGSATRDEAIREAADLLVAAGAVTSAYYDAMLAREQTVSTYMGNELAIPHGTNDAKDAILASALSVVRYDGGVDWDGETVTFVVGIAGVGDEHLEILSQIAILFSDEDDVARLKAAATSDDLFAIVSAAGVEAVVAAVADEQVVTECPADDVVTRVADQGVADQIGILCRGRWRRAGGWGCLGRSVEVQCPVVERTGFSGGQVANQQGPVAL